MCLIKQIFHKPWKSLKSLINLPEYRVLHALPKRMFISCHRVVTINNMSYFNIQNKLHVGNANIKVAHVIALIAI